MIFDNEAQKKFILALIDNAQFPGTLIEQVVGFKAAVVNAPIITPPAAPGGEQGQGAETT